MGNDRGQGFVQEDERRNRQIRQVLVAALEYYADTRNWTEYPSSPPFALQDKGKVAKEALQKIKDIRNAPYFR